MRVQDSHNTPAPNTEIPALCTVEAVANQWGVKADTIRSWVRAGKIESTKIGRLVLIRVESLPHGKA